MGSRKRRFSKEALFKKVEYTPHPGQLEIHRDEHPIRVVACGVRWGKTLLAAMEVVYQALLPRDRPVHIWIVAPQYDLAEKCFRAVRSVMRQHFPLRIVPSPDSDRVLLLINFAGAHSEIRIKSADSPHSLIAESLDFVVLDEAARLEPDIWYSCTERLVDKKGSALVISTPYRKGYFFDLVVRGRGNDPACKSWNCPSWTNPHLDPRIIEEQRRTIPDGLYRQDYEAEFVDGADAVFRKVREAATGELQDPVQGNTYFIGVDLAKARDYTVAVVLDRGGRVVAMERFHRIDWSMQVARVKALSEKYGRARITLDSTGVGEPVYELFAKEGCPVNPYLLTHASKEALIKNLSIMLDQKKLILPKPEQCQVLIDEMEAFEYTVTDSMNVRMGAPSGCNDDCVIALALAAWGLKDRPREQMVSTTPPLVVYADGTTSWDEGGMWPRGGEGIGLPY